MMVSNAGERIFELVELLRRGDASAVSGDPLGTLRHDVKACLGKYPPGEQIVFDAEHARDKAVSDLAEAKAVIAPLRVEIGELKRTHESSQQHQAKRFNDQFLERMADEKKIDKLSKERDTLAAEIDDADKMNGALIKEENRLSAKIEATNAALSEAKRMLGEAANHGVPGKLLHEILNFEDYPRKPYIAYDANDPEDVERIRQYQLKEAEDRAVRMDERTEAYGRAIRDREDNPEPKPGWSTLIESAKARAGGIAALSRYGGFRYLADVNIACATAICMAVEAKGEKLTP